MESQVPKPETKITEANQPSDFSSDFPGMLTKPASSDGIWQNVQELTEIANEYLKKLPEQFRDFFANYQNLIVFIALIVSGFVAVYLTIAVLSAIDDLPLIGPFLELIGLGYTAWFVYRYAWRAETRSELFREFDVLKSQVIGDKK